MCGISLIISLKNEPISFDLIKSFNDKVLHRGPDDEGFYLERNYALGHRRLSVIDLSSAGHQPFQRKNLIITYNGEIYNYIELRDELSMLGHQFKTATDTEVILAAYEQWGTEAFSKLNGMWAFALLDKAKNEFILCRDHFGIKPLYITNTQNYFLAASEIKQFTSLNEFNCILNKNVAANFLAHGVLNDSHETFFKGVSEVGPGQFLTYDLKLHKQKVVTWYDLRQKVKPVKDNYERAVKKVRGLFNESVALRMRSDLPVGSCLSGGIDSSAIVTTIKSRGLVDQSLPTITSCFDHPSYDEQSYSDLVTKSTGFESIKIYPQLDELFTGNYLDRMIYHHDQPFPSGSHFLEFCVYQAAQKSRLTVMQGGQGSDEILCGYDDFFSVYASELFWAFRFKKLINFLKKRAKLKCTDLQKEAISIISNVYFPRALRFIKMLLGRKCFLWMSAEWRGLANKQHRYPDQKTINGLSLQQMKYTSLAYQLHSEDRNSMAHSVESRLPFLDHRLVEYCMGLPAEYKIKNGYNKYVFREAVEELPDSIRWRKHKMGFPSPDEEWILRNQSLVGAELEKCLENSNIFSVELLNRFKRFVEGDLPFESIYFRAIALNKFIEIFKVKLE